MLHYEVVKLSTIKTYSACANCKQGTCFVSSRILCNQVKAGVVDFCDSQYLACLMSMIGKYMQSVKRYLHEHIRACHAGMRTRVVLQRRVLAGETQYIIRLCV